MYKYENHSLRSTGGTNSSLALFASLSTLASSEVESDCRQLPIEGGIFVKSRHLNSLLFFWKPLVYLLHNITGKLYQSLCFVLGTVPDVLAYMPKSASIFAEILWALHSVAWLRSSFWCMSNTFGDLCKNTAEGKGVLTSSRKTHAISFFCLSIQSSAQAFLNPRTLKFTSLRKALWWGSANSARV